MQFGVCGNPDKAFHAKQAGFEFAEWSVSEALMPLKPQDLFLAALENLRAAKLPYPVLNGLLPGKLKVTGPDANEAELRKFATIAMERAEQAGVDCIVFGSGAARRIPEGFPVKDAHDQLVGFCAMLAPIARNHGVTVVVEPLNSAECNVLTTVPECAALVREVAHPGFRLLVDAYHFMREKDSYEALVAQGSLLAHVHIATLANRRTPAAEPCDFGDFFGALHAAGYRGRVSIEASIQDPASELPAAIALMRSLAVPVCAQVPG